MGAQFKRVAINLLDFFCSCNPPECSQHSCKLNCGSFILPASFSVIGISLIIILVQIFYTAELKGNRPTTFLLKTFTKASTRMADKKKLTKSYVLAFIKMQSQKVIDTAATPKSKLSADIITFVVAPTPSTSTSCSS